MYFMTGTIATSELKAVAEISVGQGAAVPPPPTFVENDEFSEILAYKGLKTAFSNANRGGGGCRKFESFVGNLEGFAPPPPEKVNFRHWLKQVINVFVNTDVTRKLV
jgi:hypothetical protein